MVFLAVYLPVALVAARCSDRSIMEGDARVDDERERVLDTDSPRLS